MWWITKRISDLEKRFEESTKKQAVDKSDQEISESQSLNNLEWLSKSGYLTISSKKSQTCTLQTVYKVEFHSDFVGNKNCTAFAEKYSLKDAIDSVFHWVNKDFKNSKEHK